VSKRAVDDFVFAERLEELSEELEVLNAEARQLEERIGVNLSLVLEAVTR
jgi:type I restriction enzyme M protein